MSPKANTKKYINDGGSHWLIQWVTSPTAVLLMFQWVNEYDKVIIFYSFWKKYIYHGKID